MNLCALCHQAEQTILHAFVVLSSGKRSKMFGPLGLFRLQKTSSHQGDFRDLCDQLLHTPDIIVLMLVWWLLFVIIKEK